jgi:hypothetical protein
VFLFAKILQAVGFAHVGIGLFLGITQNDLWQELYLTLTGLALFVVGRWMEPRS